MTLESFEARHFQAKTAAMIDHANSIIAEYQARGFALTLRQLYYQFVARSLIDNKQSDHKRLGDVIKNGRRCGLIDWEAIEDRTRNLQRKSSREDPPDRRDMLGSTHAFDSRGRPLGVFKTKAAAASPMGRAGGPFDAHGARGGGKIGTFATSKKAAEAVRKQFRRYEAPRARTRAKAAKLAGRTP